MPKLTKRLIDGLKPHIEKDTFGWDSELRGFGIRIKPSGTASYIVQYRTHQGSTRRYAFARLGTLTPEEARKKARLLLAEISGGGDPSEQRHQRREALTVKELCEQYLEALNSGLIMTRFKQPKKSSTIEIDKGRISRHIVPLIGSILVKDLNRTHVQRMADAITAGKTATVVKTGLRGKAIVRGGAGTAARVVELLGGIWSWGEKRGITETQNPARGIDKRKGQTKERILSPDELAELGKTLERLALIYPAAVSAIRLLALTGARKEEICGLRWIEIDFNGQSLRLEATKTGRSMRPIGKPAIELLHALPRMNNDFVFPSSSGNDHAYLNKRLAAIFDEAGLSDARAQTLRRTFASVAADEGYSEATIGELLGHARRGVTTRHYIRRPDAALLSAADITSKVIFQAMKITTE